MLDPSVLTDLEELTLCGYCKLKYNDTEQCPKYLSCKHYFCLKCMENNLLKGRELFCAHCWKRTELGDQGPDALPTNLPMLALANNFAYLKMTSNSTPTKLPEKERKSENCHTHGMPLALWCSSCCLALCRACATPQEHPGHQIKTHTDAKEQLISDVQLELATMGKLSTEIQRLAMQQREFLIKVLEACVTLKTHVETDLQNGWTHFPEISDARETLGKAKASLIVSDTPSDIYNLHSNLVMEKQRLQSKYQEMLLQCQLDDLIGNSGVVFDFTLLKQALASIHSGEPVLPQPPGNGSISNHLAAAQNPILFLANYCMSQLYSRHLVSKQHLQNGSIDYHTNIIPVQTSPGSINIHPVPLPQQISSQSQHQTQLLILPESPSVKQVSSLPNSTHHIQSHQNAFIQENSPGGASGVGSLSVHSSTSNNSINVVMRGPTNPYPMYYFNIEVNGTPHGRIVIEVRPDVAPKMVKNFSVLATGEIGVGYKGCSIFQCWEGESVITGDFELNNGRGGRSIYEDGYFMPDDTKFPAVRGAVGMRRTQKRHDHLGMVGSQFRIILQEMRGFTGIFGHVIEGLELIEKISTYGDQAGKPTKTIIITKCGKL